MAECGERAKDALVKKCCCEGECVERALLRKVEPPAYCFEVILDLLYPVYSVYYVYRVVNVGVHVILRLLFP